MSFRGGPSESAPVNTPVFIDRATTHFCRLLMFDPNLHRWPIKETRRSAVMYPHARVGPLRVKVFAT